MHAFSRKGGKGELPHCQVEGEAPPSRCGRCDTSYWVFLISIKESANPIIIRLNMCSVNGRIDVVAKNISVRKYGACNDH